MAIVLGVDPGWAKCGFAILEEKDGKFTLIDSRVLSPKTLGLIGYSNHLKDLTYPYQEQIASSGVERYVVYRGIKATHVEEITMVVGATAVSLPKPLFLLRAVEWKNYLLHKLKLSTNEGKLDKVFSFQAAEAIVGKAPKTDHEADAIAIAYVSYQLSITQLQLQLT